MTKPEEAANTFDVLRRWTLNYDFDGFTMRGDLLSMDEAGNVYRYPQIVLRTRHGLFDHYTPTRKDLFDRANDYIGWVGENAWVRRDSQDVRGHHFEEWQFCLPEYARKQVTDE